MKRTVSRKNARKLAALLAASTTFSVCPAISASWNIQAEAAIAEAGGTLQTIPATGPEEAA